MEEARHWVWAKRKHGLISTSKDHLHVSKKASSCDDSWEEQAFAEDASGSLGGCIWPPRSYSCSFCGREFRSAQALGGHMNVHRRDRARLKQSPPDLHREILHQSHHHNNNLPVKNINPLITSFGSPQYPSQVCALVYNPNPNSNHGDPANFIESPPPCQKSFHEKQILFPHYYCSSSSLLQENNNKKRSNTSSISPPSSQIWSNLATDRYNHSSNQKNHIVEKQISSITDHVESAESCRDKGDYHVKTHDLSVSLNLVVCHSCPTMSDGKEEIITPETTCKRRRANYTEPSLPPSPRLKPCAVDSHDHVSHQSEAFELSPCSIEDLDLELRLGGQPYKGNWDEKEKRGQVIQKEFKSYPTNVFH